MAYEALLFDMDGVIVDTEVPITRFWTDLAMKHGVRLTPEDFARDVYGRPSGETLTALFPGLSAEERGKVFAQLAVFEKGIEYTPMPGAVPFVENARSAGISLALVTSGERWKVDAVLSQLGLTNAFDVSLSASDSARGKPDPCCYLRAAGLLGREPEQCIVFEDTTAGVKAGAASGALCIGIAPPERAVGLLAAGAEFVVAGFHELSLASPSGAGTCQLHVLHQGKREIACWRPGRSLLPHAPPIRAHSRGVPGKG